MIVKYSNSVEELLFNKRYEGHPSIWFLLLYLLKFFSLNLLSFKIIHIVIASCSAYLLLKYSPFSLIQKILLLTSYFLAYEYVAIVRNYAIGILFIFSFCTLFPFRKSPKHFIYISVSIAGMFLSNFYSFFIGISLVILLIAEIIFYKNYAKSSINFIYGFLIIFASLILFLVDTPPPKDTGLTYSWNFNLNLSSVRSSLARVCNVFFPIPNISKNFWNTSYIKSVNLQAFLGFTFLVLIFFILPKKKLSQVFIISLFLLIGIFSHIKFNGYLRHNGHLFIGLIVMLWLQNEIPGERKKSTFLDEKVINSFLVIQSFAMVLVVVGELLFPFSQAKMAASYIQKKFNNAIVVADEETACSTVKAYLENKFYYVRSQEFGTYILWKSNKLNLDISNDFLINKGDSLSKITQQNVIYLTTHPIDNEKIKLIKLFSPSIEPLESFYLYSKKQ